MYDLRKLRTVFYTFLIILSSLSGSYRSEAYEERPVIGGGTVYGRATFTGKDPAGRLYPVTKDMDICGGGYRQVDFVKVDRGGLGDVVVYIEGIAAGKPFPPYLSKGKIEQKNCRFNPFLQVIKKGSSLTVINSDPMQHNIHPYEIAGNVKNTIFNVSQPTAGSFSKEISLKRSNKIKVECDAHNFMHAYLFVASSPYFAIVTESGEYTIDGVPPGKYKVKAWHGSFRELETEVHVTAGSAVRADFNFRKER